MNVRRIQPGLLFRLLALTMLLVSCSPSNGAAGPGQPLPETNTPASSVTEEIQPMPGLPSSEDTPTFPGTPGTLPVVEPGMEHLVALSRADLAERLGIPEMEIQVLESRSVVWPDASLGCPKPGMLYIQILMEGALIRLSAAGTAYEYHVGGSGDPFLCEQPSQAPVQLP